MPLFTLPIHYHFVGLRCCRLNDYEIETVTMIHIHELFLLPGAARDFAWSYRKKYALQGAVCHLRREGTFWAVVGHRFVK